MLWHDIPKHAANTKKRGGFQSKYDAQMNQINDVIAVWALWWGKECLKECVIVGHGNAADSSLLACKLQNHALILIHR